MEFIKAKIILTGATGMVGEGVLHECLSHESVEKVLLISRKPTGISHPKLEEAIQADMRDLRNLSEEICEYDTCFYCIGTTSMGKTEEEYKAVTYQLTIDFANALLSVNHEITFCYISAAGSDLSERGKTMWARVKGRTENKLMVLPFACFYSFRPLMLTPTPGMKHTHGFYKFISWFFPIGRLLKPDWFCTLRELGQAMIAVALNGYPRRIIEVRDIADIANRANSRK
ncbi:NAD-dependent epimerase/dehydratase family protein [Mucilaginibacter sp. cycad4]|uniref:NAD-dependent epimerase/dehydratase family protein n=1 Tax=Mucilaginibacter sp. cycad4 TaxID=3342096 RepID=UPI002AAAA6E0|nr:NAD-dependent epimerase/dehydratase family protein [Mucilaginibacter gossypii]WPU99121.1 NAD-dependent epimerase/dehydratase family protein [Mucilaginibacter gossypii]